MNNTQSASDQDVPVIAVRYKALLTFAIMLGTLLQLLDTTIANVALPHMQASLGASQDSVNWILTSYIIAAAVAIPITGWLADRFGVRRLFLTAIAAFIFASMLCGIATSLEEMVIFRFLQGVAGAFISPLAQSLMLDINKRSDHAKAMAIFGIGVMVGPILGPMIGGWLTESWNWRWVFYVNLPSGLLCFVLLWLLLPDKKGAGRPFDIFGFLILAMGLVSLQLLFDRGERIDWFSSKEAWIELAIAVSSFWILAIHIFTSDRTIWPKAMITDRNVLTGAIFMFVVGLIALAVMALLPPLLQGIYRYSVMDAGILLSSRGIGVVITMALVGRIIGFTDPRVLAALGIFLVAVSLWLMTGWAIDQDWQHVVTSGLIQGFGLGLVFVPMNVISFATISSAYRTDAAAFINLWRNIGSSLGVSIMAAMLARNIQVSHADLAQHITGERVPVDPTVATALGDSGIPILSLVDAEITRQATMIAFLDDFKLMAIACVFVIPLLLFIKPVNRTAGPSTPLME